MFRGHSIGHLMKEDWDDSTRPCLDRKGPALLGLIFDKKTTLADGLQAGAAKVVTKQHQVLGIGYTQNGDNVQLRAYDPNYPGDTLLMQFVLGRRGVDQQLMSGASLGSDRRRPRGIMHLRCVKVNAPCRGVGCPCNGNVDCRQGLSCNAPRPGKPEEPHPIGSTPSSSSESRYCGYSCSPTGWPQCGAGQTCVQPLGCRATCQSSANCRQGSTCRGGACLTDADVAAIQ